MADFALTPPQLPAPPQPRVKRRKWEKVDGGFTFSYRPVEKLPHLITADIEICRRRGEHYVRFYAEKSILGLLINFSHFQTEWGTKDEVIAFVDKRIDKAIRIFNALDKIKEAT